MPNNKFPTSQLPTSSAEKNTAPIFSPAAVETNYAGENIFQDRVNALAQKAEQESQPAYVAGKLLRKFWNFVTREGGERKKIMEEAAPMIGAALAIYALTEIFNFAREKPPEPQPEPPPERPKNPPPLHSFTPDKNSVPMIKAIARTFIEVPLSSESLNEEERKSLALLSIKKAKKIFAQIAEVEYKSRVTIVCDGEQKISRVFNTVTFTHKDEISEVEMDGNKSAEAIIGTKLLALDLNEKLKSEVKKKVVAETEVEAAKLYVYSIFPNIPEGAEKELLNKILSERLVELHPIKQISSIKLGSGRRVENQILYTQVRSEDEIHPRLDREKLAWATEIFTSEVKHLLKKTHREAVKPKSSLVTTSSAEKLDESRGPNSVGLS